MSTRKKHKKTDSNPARQHTLGVSYKEEADIDYKDGLESLNKFQSSGLTYHLRQAGIRLKMAAERYDRSEHLLGNTLEGFIKEAEKR